MESKRVAVILAGGSGERFWPLSNSERPKQLLKLTHPDETLLEEAVRRIVPLVGHDHVFIATGRNLAAPVRESSIVPAEHVIVEPTKRDTMGALAWVAASLAASHPEGTSLTLAVLTADHKIGDPELFRATVNRALELAESTEGLVTIGIAPTRPETGFGYIEVDRTHDVGDDAFRARSFREKPTPEAAERYLLSGDFLWNSGMFFWRLDAFLRELRAANPEAATIVDGMTVALRAGDAAAAEELFTQLVGKSVDYALMEKAAEVYVVRGGFKWDDVGSWDALIRSMPLDASNNVVQGKVMCLDTAGSVVYNDQDDVMVATLGVHDLIVVVTKDAVLVCGKDQAQRVREIVKAIEAANQAP
jgi:mannose-1-phosphate guanylyltransferase